MASNSTFVIVPFSFRSGSISFNDWVSLLTLCFAPLVAHIIAGRPEPIIQHKDKGPQWLDHFVLYNPTTILFRYCAIASRRLRFKSGAWTPVQAASANAIIWTKDGWDGSIDMVELNRKFLTKHPEKSRAKLLSWSSLKSIVTTLQGVQAVYFFSTDLSDMVSCPYAYSLAVDSIFSPLATMGLLRLCAAVWLTDDFTYSFDQPEQEAALKLRLEIAGPLVRGDLLRPTSDWRSRIFRIVYSLVILFLLGMGIVYLLPFWGVQYFTVTTFFLDLFYTFFLLSTVIILGFYLFVRERAMDTTILPCVSSSWYKFYTALLTLAVIALIIVAAVETRQTACGKTTSWPEREDIELTLCPNLQSNLR